MSVLEWKSGTALANGLALAWEETGPASGEPLVLVMGLAGQLIHWPESLCADLAARGFRVIRFDNRDIGLSGEANRGLRFNMPADWVKAKFGVQVRANYTLHDMAADTVGLLDALGIERTHLAGVSMGGMISQITAARHSRRVRSLTSIMSSTNHPNLPPPDLRLMWRMSGMGPRDHSREGVVQRTASLFEIIGSPSYPTPPEQRREMAGRAYDRAFRPGGVLRQTHGILATGSFEDLLGQVRAPTQIIHGLADPLVRPACGKRSARLIPDAQLELIPGMGHDLPLALMPRLSELIAANAGRA